MTPRPWGRGAPPVAAPFVAAAMVLALAWAAPPALGQPSPPAAGPGDGLSKAPSILFIVWDTVRADYLSLYGCEHPTTPFLDRWALGARVFEDCVSVGSTTTPTHVSMFTGLLPLEHQVDNNTRLAGDDLQMLAETLKGAGYDTYLFSENPRIARQTNLTQGFDRTEHPWSAACGDRVLAWYRAHVPPDTGPAGSRQEARRRFWQSQALKTAGPVLEAEVTRWLDQRPSGRPYFVFLNYMAAHTPLLPDRSHRTAIMAPGLVERSYELDYTEPVYWGYVFRRHEYAEEDLVLMRLTYAAAVRELDASLESLLTRLDQAGHLTNTIVVLTSDHGEHLGDHHLLDHQYSVYEALLRVPLVLYYPPTVAAGRAPEPVTNMDIYPTLLEMAGVAPPAVTGATSLLRPAAKRTRLGTYTGVETKRFALFRREHKGFDPAPWNRELHAYYCGPYKLIISSDQRHELYDLVHDPGEVENLFRRAGTPTSDLVRNYLRAVNGLQKRRSGEEPPSGPLDREYLERLRAIGYLDGEPEEAPPAPAAREESP